MKINKHHGTYNRQRRIQPVKYIVVHYVGSGTSAAGNALANCKYFAGGDRQASAHYFIDDGGIWEYADPETYVAWHCGDGHGAYGITNANSIGIEVCMNGDKPFTAKEITFLKQLVVHLMKRFSVPASHVVRHFDASRKQCPLFYAKRQKEWIALRKTITGASSIASKAKAKTYDGTFPVLPAKGYLREGDLGTQVKRLQQFLNWYGDYGLDIDGSFGIATKTALKEFQKSTGLVSDGHFGPASLKKAKAVRK